MFRFRFFWDEGGICNCVISICDMYVRRRMAASKQALQSRMHAAMHGKRARRSVTTCYMSVGAARAHAAGVRTQATKSHAHASHATRIQATPGEFCNTYTRLAPRTPSTGARACMPRQKKRPRNLAGLPDLQLL